MHERIEAQEHRRFVKSHLPLDALPYWDDVKYIAVGRDTRDVFMSVFNHYLGLHRLRCTSCSPQATRSADRCRAVRTTRATLWPEWITTPDFPWEPDGSPWWSHHYHVESFWKHRDLPNVLMVHYADMKADLEGEMRRIAAFLGIEHDEAMWPELVHGATLRLDEGRGEADAATGWR